MKLCDYHIQALRSKFAARGIETPANGLEAQKFHAAGEADLLNSAIQHILVAAYNTEPDLVTSPPEVCPICYLVKPSWLDEAVEGQINNLRQKQ